MTKAWTLLSANGEGRFNNAIEEVEGRHAVLFIV
jgi:hypothetical protein